MVLTILYKSDIFDILFKNDSMSIFVFWSIMALEAFYNLKEKKKKNILNAISICLRNKNYDELSVNDISIEADISRGSFYNYFNDKYDAVCTLVDSKIKEHFEQYKTAIINSNNNLIEGTRKVYNDIKDILKDEINVTIMRNLKFFIEFGVKSVHSKRFENDIDEFVSWLINNTIEGKTTLNSYKKMANVLDILITIVLNTLFSLIMFDSKYFLKYDDFNFKLELIKKSIY